MELTIYFDGQFWVGLLLRKSEKGLYASRHVFGPEPNDGEVCEFINTDLQRLLDTQTVAIDTDKSLALYRRINPKRLQRLVNKERKKQGPTNIAQDALRAQLEVNKKERKVQSKQQRLEDKERKWQMAREKAKERHRGK